MTDSRNLSGDREQTKSELLEKRMLHFAVDVIRRIKKSDLPRSLGDQLTRSCASIGANYAEACNAASRLDFKNKIYIAKKEAAETRYWIDLCIELTNAQDWRSARQESHDLLVILQTIINSLRSKSDK